MTMRRLLTQPCLACNRILGESMCELCAELEAAEETASERRDDAASASDRRD